MARVNSSTTRKYCKGLPTDLSTHTEQTNRMHTLTQDEAAATTTTEISQLTNYFLPSVSVSQWKRLGLRLLQCDPYT